MKSIALLALISISSADAMAQVDQICPPANSTEIYIDSYLRSKIPQQSVLGSLRMYARLLAPFDAEKPTLLVINGGPGGDHSIVKSFDKLSSTMNVVSFDHRGLGCTKITSRFDSEFVAGIYSMDQAANDLDYLRRQLLGKDGKWWVYGVSYGGMLGQRYILKHPSHILGAILDSTFHRSTAIDVGRRQYKSLFIDQNPEVKALYDEIVAKYPDARESILWTIWGETYSYEGRLKGIKEFFRTILAAPSPDAARRLYQREKYDGPISGMSYEIICQEIWDFPSHDDHKYYFADFVTNCSQFKKIRIPMDWGNELSRLPVRTFIWAGAFDPVTPASVMREMHELIPNSILYENSEAGHGLWWEKPECALNLLRKFVAESSNETLEKLIASQECQSAPEFDKNGLNRWERITGQKVPSF
jgi:pimeloyl-ACP methyl ester carboxylesterase